MTSPDAQRWRQSAADLAHRAALTAGVLAAVTVDDVPVVVFGDPEAVGDLLGAVLGHLLAAWPDDFLAVTLAQAATHAVWARHPDHPLWTALFRAAQATARRAILSASTAADDARNRSAPDDVQTS